MRLFHRHIGFEVAVVVVDDDNDDDDDDDDDGVNNGIIDLLKDSCSQDIVLVSKA